MRERVVVAVDPGDKHVGIAIWEKGKIKASEVDAESALNLIEARLGARPRVDALVIENFILFPAEAPALSKKPLRTPEMIGALKLLAKQNDVPWVEQSPAVKGPTKRQCVARRLYWDHSSIHARDAIMHMHYYLLRNGLE